MVRNIRWQATIALLGSLLLVTLLGHLTAGRTTVLVPAVGGRYVEALVGYAPQINPLLAYYGTPERDLCALIFSGLTRAEANGDIVPDLTQVWEISEDGQSFTFYLRRNVRWHDGTPFTAQDVVFTIGLIQADDFAGRPELAAVWRDVQVQAVDAYTVVFDLPQAYAPFLEQTTLGLLPAHLLEGLSPAEVGQHRFNQQPIGTGPFRLEMLTADYARLVPHAQYYGPRPYLSTLDFRFYPDAASALSAYERGEVMGLGGLAPEFLDRVASQPDLNLFSSLFYGYGLVVLNNRQPIFADRQVRQALLYALNRQALIDDVLYGQGVVAHSPIMPGHWAYEPDVQHYDLDVAQGTRLLDEAGWRHTQSPDFVPEDGSFQVPSFHGPREKDGQPFAFTLLTDDNPVHQRLAESLIKQWSRLGARAKVQVVSISERDELLASYRFDAVLLEVALPADPDLYAWWHSTQADGGQNYAGFANFAADAALQQGRLVTKRAQRWAFYRAFQQIFAREVPAILLYYPVYTYGIDQRLKDVQLGTLLEPSDRFRNIYRWYLITQSVIVQQSQTSAR